MSIGMSRKKITSLLEKHFIKPSLALDQNFFNDYTMLKKIVGYAKLTKEDVVVEIGPGLGFLTKELAKKAGKVIAIEKDERFIDVLEEELEGQNNVQIIIGNALDFIDSPETKSYTKIVANMPYNLCEPLLQKIKNYNFELLVLLVSKNFAHKMVGEGKLGKLCKRWRIEFLNDVEPESFYPKPKILSKIVRITQRNKPKTLK